MALKDERERIDTLASQHAQLVENCERTGFQYKDAFASRNRIQTRMNEIERLLNVLPRLTELRVIRERLVPLENLPVPPLGWAEELPKLQSDDIKLATRAEGLEAEITQLVAALDAIVVDETALKLADKAARLVELRARYLTAEKDIPERLLQANEADVVISGILSRIGHKGEVAPGAASAWVICPRLLARVDGGAIGYRCRPEIGGKRIGGSAAPLPRSAREAQSSGRPTGGAA